MRSPDTSAQQTPISSTTPVTHVGPSLELPGTWKQIDGSSTGVPTQAGPSLLDALGVEVGVSAFAVPACAGLASERGGVTNSHPRNGSYGDEYKPAGQRDAAP